VARAARLGAPAVDAAAPAPAGDRARKRVARRDVGGDEAGGHLHRRGDGRGAGDAHLAVLVPACEQGGAKGARVREARGAARRGARRAARHSPQRHTAELPRAIAQLWCAPAATLDQRVPAAAVDARGRAAVGRVAHPQRAVFVVACAARARARGHGGRPARSAAA
jgi:hypothetical protein